MSVYAVSSEIYRFFKVFMQHVECFLFGIMLTIKCFQFLVLRNKVKKLKNRKKEEKNTFCNSFPGLSYEDEGRDEKALVWAGHVTTRKMAVFDSYSSRSGEIFFNEIYKSSKQIK